MKPKKPNDFTGNSKELEDWLYSMGLYCYSQNISTDLARIKCALPYLKGNASTWLRTVCPEGQWGAAPWATWADFCTALRSNFGPLQVHRQARERLDELKQKQRQSMEDYVQAFRMVLLELPNVTAEEAIHRFKKGIFFTKVKEYITQATAGRTDEELTLEEVVKLATTAEMDLIPTHLRNGRAMPPGDRWSRRAHTRTFHQQPSYDSRPTAMELGNINSRQEYDRETLFHQGRCFYCKERGHRKADCPKLKQGNGKNRQ